MKRLLFSVVFFVLGLFTTLVDADQHKKVYTVGIVPQFEVRKLHAIWRPILDLVENKTGYKFKSRGSASIPEFEKEFIAGKFDFAYMNPYHLILANKFAGYIPLVRDHGRKLYGVLVVHKDSDITDPAQLNGAKVAFPSPNALGASLQIRKDLQDDFDINFQPQYVKTHDSVYLNVLLGEVSAGGGVQKTLNRQKPQYKEMLRVIHTTQKVEPHPLAVLPETPEEVRTRVQDALLEIGQSVEGKKLEQ